MVKENPKFIYGTAWKEKKTAKLVELAIECGFRAIDTANQARHYTEILVGKALANASKKGVTRDQIWLQSKFTSLDGQDDRLPYDKDAKIGDQVRQSFASSLEHLGTDYLDSYLLHGPYNYPLLGDEDFEVWQVLEELYKSGVTKSIGISNVNLAQLEMLCQQANIKPMMVQNRCYAIKAWDKEIRDFCQKNDIHYQGFSLLTANMNVFADERIVELAQKYQVTPAQIVFRFAYQIGMIPLTGTTDKEHMKVDLEIFNFEFLAEELLQIENILLG